MYMITLLGILDERIAQNIAEIIKKDLPDNMEVIVSEYLEDVPVIFNFELAKDPTDELVEK